MQHPSRPLPPMTSNPGRQTVVVIRPSILRLGLVARLAGAACVVSGIWVAISWVIK